MRPSGKREPTVLIGLLPNRDRQDREPPAISREGPGLRSWPPGPGSADPGSGSLIRYSPSCRWSLGFCSRSCRRASWPAIP